jgi:hypothetical protein
MTRSEESHRPEREKRPASNTAVVALAVSIAGLLFSGLNLYLTQLRAPRVEAAVGPSLLVYHPFDGGFGMYVPVSLLNTTARGAAVLRARAQLRLRSDSRVFEFEWANFVTRDQHTGNFTFNGEAGPIAVAPNSAASRLVFFVWRPTSRPDLELKSGTYDLRLLFWTDDSFEPSMEIVHSFLVSPELAETLRLRRQEQDGSTSRITLEGMQPENVVRTQSQQGP